MLKCLLIDEAFEPVDLKMLRLLTCSVLWFALLIGHYQADDAVAGNKSPNDRTTIEQLLPSPRFSHGMSAAALELQIETQFSDWLRTDTQRAMNNRSDIDLPSHAKEKYVQRISISYEDKKFETRHSYFFALTSPLSGSRVYSIVYVIEAIGDHSSILSWSDLANSLHSRWGVRHSGNWTEDRARSTYLFGTDGSKLEDAMERCGMIYSSAHRLDEKTEQQVTTASEYLLSNDCGYSKDFTFALEGDKVTKSSFYDVDHHLHVSDVLKRVVYGIK